VATGLLRVDELKLTDLQAAARRTLGETLMPDILAAFLASVDWSGYRNARVDVRELLGVLEALATDFAEGDITTEEYQSTLRGIAQAKVA